MSTTAGGFAAGSLAACGAVIATHPFETVKTRLQLQGELAAKSETKRVYTGVFQAVSLIVRNEGVRGLYRGIGAGLMYQIGLNGCRFGFYEPIRANLTKAWTKNPQSQIMGINVVAGATSGVIGAVVGSPFFLVKTRLQSHSPVFPVGTQHNYKNFVDGFRQIIRADGIQGIYRGVGAAMIRVGFGSSVQLPTYYLAKRTIIGKTNVKDGPLLHLACSSVSGVMVCIFMHPPDTIMNRLYNQTGNKYNGILDCLVKTVSKEGPLAVYKGFFAHLARILPHTVLTLSLAEQTTKLVRNIESRIL